MISQDILPEIMLSKDKDNNFIKNEVLKHKERLLYLFLHKLTIRIIKHSIQWQPYEYLFLDNNEKLWGELPVVNDFIEMLIICDIIKVNYNKTHFKIIHHNPRDVLVNAKKLIEIIGYDKYQELLKYSEFELIQFINHSDIKIINAVLMDIQLWNSNYE